MTFSNFVWVNIYQFNKHNGSFKAEKSIILKLCVKILSQFLIMHFEKCFNMEKLKNNEHDFIFNYISFSFSDHIIKELILFYCFTKYVDNNKACQV